MVKQMKRVLITGLGGFTGRYVESALRSAGYDVYALSRTGLPVHQQVLSGDLLDPVSLRSVVREVRPQAVIHLAGVSSITHNDVEEIYRTNIMGTRNLLVELGEAVKSGTLLESVVLASSANIYGNGHSFPINESCSIAPANDYAVSKYSMELMAATWADILPISILRPFNYTGVGQSTGFVIPKVIEAFARKEEFLTLGNIDVARDFCDVRDVAAAYVKVMENRPRTIVNICSGTAMSLKCVLAYVERISGHAVTIKSSGHLLRRNEVGVLQGDPTKLRDIIGVWNPRPLSETLQWMFNAYSSRN